MGFLVVLLLLLVILFIAGDNTSNGDSDFKSSTDNIGNTIPDH